MGVSDINLGLILTEGSVKSYSVNGTKTNHRGIFLLNPEHFELLPNEEYVIEWQMFWHKGTDDFYKKAAEFETFINIEAPRFTDIENENIEFTVTSKLNDNIIILSDGKEIPFEKTEKGCKVCCLPQKLGEHRCDIQIGSLHTYTEFFVAENIETLVEKKA